MTPNDIDVAKAVQDVLTDAKTIPGYSEALAHDQVGIRLTTISTYKIDGFDIDTLEHIRKRALNLISLGGDKYECRG